MSIPFDIKLSLQLDQVIIDLEEATAKGPHGTAARFREIKHKLEGFIFDGSPRPQRNLKLDYYIYIQSQEWRDKAEAAKRRAGYRCQVCNRSQYEIKLDAHHRTYERLGEELPEDITVMCTACHHLFEQNKRIIQ